VLDNCLIYNLSPVATITQNFTLLDVVFVSYDFKNVFVMNFQPIYLVHRHHCYTAAWLACPTIVHPYLWGKKLEDLCWDSLRISLR